MNQKGKTIGSHVVVILICFIMIYPVLWWLGAVFKPLEEMSFPRIWPANPTLDNFIEGWNALPNYSFTYFYFNTLKLLLGVLFTTLISTSLVAYGFARLDFPLRKFWFAIVLVTLMLPTQVTLVPQYIMYNAFGWVNTYLPFIVPHALGAGVGGSFFIFMLVQFIKGIPRDLDEAAKIDGCKSFRIYYHIILPLLKAPLATIFIFCFLWNWDDFFGHLIYINSIENYTVDLALKMFIDAESSSPWGQLFAMSLISVMPATVVFFVGQRYMVEGIATTGIKG